VEFVRDNKGKPVQLKWIQPIPPGGLSRVASPEIDSVANSSRHELSKYVGNYQLSANRYKVAQVRIDNNQLTIQFAGEGKLFMKQESSDRFVIEDGDMRMVYDFVRNAAGKFDHINFSRTGGVVFVRSEKKVTTPSEVIYGFKRPNGFTRADTLRGKLSALRSCYDVLFYDLNVSVHPETKSVSGSNVIRFKAVEPFDQMQVDLFSNMRIEKITFHDQPLSFTREYNAVFVRLPQKLEQGTSHEITVAYSGKPQKPDGASLAGGVFWLQDKEGNEWIETVTQGSGASLWWPCKDHLSDKPDSMQIRVTVPRGLTDISNGKLRKKSELPNGQTQFDWYVGYPITTYCVAMNIGRYVQLTDRLARDGDTLQLYYYSKPYDVKLGKSLFKKVKPMLNVFEKHFGEYPFIRDGFTVMESIYPMEHQGAVTFGSLFNPFNSDKYDSADILRTMWHEVAHEWWGNNVTVRDYADLWIHEAFATYAEVLAYKELNGEAAAKKYLKEQIPGNNEPIIGRYDVNDFRLGDMYSKGVLMLYTLQNVIYNDALWFDLLLEIQHHFAFQTITTSDLVNYINQKTKTDFTYFFDQYLKFASIPELQLKFEKRGKDTIVKYKWKADVSNFIMPIRVTTSENNYEFIYPVQDWKELNLKGMKAKNFKVDTEHFYAGVKVVK
jgi:aminopeptidase N